LNYQRYLFEIKYISIVVKAHVPINHIRRVLCAPGNKLIIKLTREDLSIILQNNIIQRVVYLSVIRHVAHKASIVIAIAIIQRIQSVIRAGVVKR